MTQKGQSRDLVCVCRLVKRQRRLAVRWSAPEVLVGQPHSTASNVWSYGVLAWEVTSLGQLPFNLWNDDQVAAAVTSGAVLSRPSVCLSINRSKCYSNTTVYYGIHERSECTPVDTGVTNLIHDRRSCVDFTLEVEANVARTA